MFTVGIPADAPTSGTVLVTSGVVTTPRQYRVRVFITTEATTWVRLAHCAAGGAVRSSILLPVNVMLGPVDIYEAYFAKDDYVQIDMRDGIDATGTVQATVGLL